MSLDEWIKTYERPSFRDIYWRLYRSPPIRILLKLVKSIVVMRAISLIFEVASRLPVFADAPYLVELFGLMRIAAITMYVLFEIATSFVFLVSRLAEVREKEAFRA